MTDYSISGRVRIPDSPTKICEHIPTADCDTVRCNMLKEGKCPYPSDSYLTNGINLEVHGSSDTAGVG